MVTILHVAQWVVNQYNHRVVILRCGSRVFRLLLDVPLCASKLLTTVRYRLEHFSQNEGEWLIIFDAGIDTDDVDLEARQKLLLEELLPIAIMILDGE